MMQNMFSARQAIGRKAREEAMRKALSMARSIVRDGAEQTPDYWRKSLKQRMDGHDKELSERLKNPDITTKMCRKAVETCVYRHESDRILLEADIRDCLLDFYMNGEFRNSLLERKTRKVAKKVEPPLGLLSGKMKEDIIALYLSRTAFFGKFDPGLVSAYKEAVRQTRRALDRIFAARGGLKFKEAYGKIMPLPLYRGMHAVFDSIDEGIVRSLIMGEIALKFETFRFPGEAGGKWMRR